MATPIIDSFKKRLLVTLAYYSIAGLIFIVILQCLHNEHLFNANNIDNWDAVHYHWIANGVNSYSNVAFFPLFPYVWKILQLSSYGIVIFNGLLFILLSALLAAVFDISNKEYLLAISFPSLIFMFLPYAESLFFFSCTIALVGIKKQNGLLTFAGLLLASMTRPVVYIFIPAVIILMFIPMGFKAVKKVLYMILPVVLGLALVLTLQHSYTHNWLAFFQVQKQWGSFLQVPKLILTSWGGDNIVRLDGSALLVGMISTVAIVLSLLKKNQAVKGDNALLFALLYLAGICWLILLTRGGSLFSLNRFVFTTPFFMLAFAKFIKLKWSNKELGIVFFLMFAFWLFFGSYVHIKALLAYLALTVFLFSFFLINHNSKYVSRLAMGICLTGNILLQLHFYYNFLDGCWVA